MSERDLNQQEQDIVDLLELHKAMTASHLCQELRWSISKLHPIIGKMEDNKLVKSETDKAYPHIKVYTLVK